ncbi:unnamed protein product [Blepharisma stoltei]|uniref:UBC core domain-containing protein n=1 Tax=Blepharisma stoltei TaxID=1481888 RepID=A0AAU9J641_9CILI|nr:unnamed protein product [Blepharisma stoltei]
MESRIHKEFNDFTSNSIENCSIEMQSDNSFIWNAAILGPLETPYEGGYFFLRITIPEDYPIKPPNVQFTTKIYHQNINPDGKFCSYHCFWKDNWSAAKTIRGVIEYIIDLLKNPIADCNADHNFDDINDTEKFKRTARIWTQRYAM